MLFGGQTHESCPAAGKPGGSAGGRMEHGCWPSTHELRGKRKAAGKKPELMEAISNQPRETASDETAARFDLSGLLQ
jgi:hypothetical protein